MSKPDANAGSQDGLVRLSKTSVDCLRRSIELVERITPGNCSHHAGNIRVMLKAVLSEVDESPNATGSATGGNEKGHDHE